MAVNNTPAVDLAFPYGVVVSYADLLATVLANKVRIGAAIAGGQGGYNFLPNAPLNPLAVTCPGGMEVTIGGTGQRVFTDGWWCDDCVAQSFTVPAAPTTGHRTDLIAIQSNLAGVVVGTVSRADINNVGVSGTVTENQTSDGVTYQYVQGDASGDVPATPTGFNAFATITVNAGVASIVPSDIAILFTSMISQGPQGIQGIQGIQGETGPMGNGFTFLGEYASATPYVVGDVVIYENSAYVCTAATTAIAPPVAAEYFAGTASADPGHAFWSPFALQGLQGIQGIQGVQGNPGETGASLNFRGAWSGSATYAVYDVITYSGSSYAAIQPSTGVVPTNTAYWALLAQAGAAGAQGATGATGAAGAPGTPGANGTNGTNGQNALGLFYDVLTDGSGSVSIVLPAGNWIVEVDLTIELANASIAMSVTGGSAAVLASTTAYASGTTNNSNLQGMNSVSGALVLSAAGGQTVVVSCGPPAYSSAGPEDVGAGLLRARAYPTS